MASTTYLDGQTPVWRTPNGSQSITIDPTSQSITVENTTIPKKIIINPIELSNGTQVLPYTQLYENINAVDACVFPAPSTDTLQVKNKISLTSSTTGTTEILLQADTTPTIPVNIVATDNTNFSSGINIDKVFSVDVSSLVGGVPTIFSQMTPTDISIQTSTAITQLTPLNIITTNGSNTATLDATTPQLALSDGIQTPVISLTSQRLTMSGNSYGIDIDSSLADCRVGDVGFTNNGTLLEITDTTQTINFNTLNLTAHTSSYTLPICYTKKMSNQINYIGVNNTWQNVYQDTLSLPNEFFSPSNAFWTYKIEFSINLRNVSFPTDKGLALYFEFLDNASNIMTPFLYNQSTPFTRHSNASTYSASSSDMLTFNWNDYCDFSVSANNAPITFSLWWYGDQNNAPDFEIVLSLTRTNLV